MNPFLAGTGSQPPNLQNFCGPPQQSRRPESAGVSVSSESVFNSTATTSWHQLARGSRLPMDEQATTTDHAFHTQFQGAAL